MKKGFQFSRILDMNVIWLVLPIHSSHVLLLQMVNILEA